MVEKRKRARSEDIAHGFSWDGTIGPATIISFCGSLLVLVAVGIAWGTTTNRLDTAARNVDDAKQVAAEIVRDSVRRDQKIADQSERLGKIETSIQFMVPTLQRIESKLTSRPPG